MGIINNAINFVAIHNKNGKGLLHKKMPKIITIAIAVAIHNKNGKGLLLNQRNDCATPAVGRNPQ